jgi:hypothetical protein
MWDRFPRLPRLAILSGSFHEQGCTPARRNVKGFSCNTLFTPLTRPLWGDC